MTQWSPRVRRAPAAAGAGFGLSGKRGLLIAAAFLTTLLLFLTGRPGQAGPPALAGKKAVASLRSPLVHLTPNQVAHLHFSAFRESQDQQTPIPIRLRYVDVHGATLFEPEVTHVLPGAAISLDLPGDGLDFPPETSQAGIRAMVDILEPAARGIASLEVEENSTSSRFVLFLDNPLLVARDPHLRFLGPISLKSTETALLNVVRGPGGLSVRLMFTQGWAKSAPGQIGQPSQGSVIVEKVERLDSQTPSANLSLAEFAGGVIFGAFRPENDGSFSAGGYIENATLEVFDSVTGEKRTMLAWPSQGGGSGGSSSGGGIGGP